VLVDVSKWYKAEIGVECVGRPGVLVFSRLYLMTASWGHSSMMVLTPFNHYYFSSLPEFFEGLWQQVCGFSWLDLDAYRCWFVCSQNPGMTNHFLSTSPTVPSPAIKMI
jgi:hypothetical protein